MDRKGAGRDMEEDTRYRGWGLELGWRQSTVRMAKEAEQDKFQKFQAQEVEEERFQKLQVQLS